MPNNPFLSPPPDFMLSGNAIDNVDLTIGESLDAGLRTFWWNKSGSVFCWKDGRDSDTEYANIYMIPELIESLKHQRQGLVNLVDLGILPHEAWEHEAQKEINSINALLTKIKDVSNLK